MTSDTFTFKSIFDAQRLPSLFTALILLALAYVAEHFANLYELEYSLRPTSTYVGDLLLDNLPTYNVHFLIINVAVLTVAIGSAFILYRYPRYVLFSIKAIALLIAIRAFFISLTHVGIYPGVIPPDYGFFTNIYTYFNWQVGFFFSGHTSIPFLMALIFWQNRRMRAIFLIMSALFGAAVLFAHIHYSIDVFAAPFMAFGIFHIAKYLFPKDYELIR
ncbi:MAG TPA: phosphatase PAP2-related protein [Candidatus Paceibacterota bacterium]|nr:phosphatase PAP2-related protein [Candidatus Paceibacterota bacterium]